MPRLLQDLIYCARGLRKSPGFSLTAIAAIAIGIGATSAIFSLLDAAILRPLPFRDARKLVAIFERPPQYLRNSVSPATYLDWRDENHSFETMGAMAFASRTLTGYGTPVRLSGQQVTSSYFEVLGVQPLLGRSFTAAEENTSVALISHRLWMQRFAGDRAALGRVITLDGQPYTISGVMPAEARVQGDPDVWTPLALDREHARRGSHTLWVIARLKTGVELTQASAEMDVIGRRIAAAAPETNGGWGVTIDPLQSYLVGADLRMTSLALFGAVGFLLLLSCVNVANLLMVRAVGRTREIAVRAALGASRSRIIWQLLTESLLISLVGGAAGLWVANLLLDVATRLLPKGTIPAAIVLQLDTRVICFTLAVSIVAGVLFGLAPAWASAAAGLAGTLRSSGRAVTSAGGVRNILASTEIALALVLLSGAGLLTRTLLRLEKVDRGYESGNVLTMRLSLPKASYPTHARAVQFYQAAESAVASLPGVRSAGFSVDLPLGGWSFGEPFEIPGKAVPKAARPFAHFQLVGPRYFDAVGIRFARGRAFDDRDTAASGKVCIVNEEFARRYFGDRDPLGASIDTLGEPWQVVGVIRQVKVEGPADQRTLEIYVPYTQSEAEGMAFAVRTSGDPVAMIKPVVAAIGRVDKDLALTDIQTLDEIAKQSVVRPRFRAGLAAAFSFAALSLAALGVYGVLAFAVNQRVKEFGIRLALGATAPSLLRLVLRDGLRIAILGLAAGLAAAAALARLLTRFLFNMSPFDPLTFAAASTLLALIAMVACIVPARRAMVVDPIVALRDE